MIQQLDKAEGGSASIIIVFIMTDSFSTVVCYRVRFYSHGIMVKGVIRGVHYTYLQDQKQWLFIRYVDEQKGENSHQRGSDPTAKTASATFLGTVSSAWHRPNHPAGRGTRNAARNVLTRIIQRNSSTTNRAIELINDRRQQLFIEKKTNRGENGHRCSDGDQDDVFGPGAVRAIVGAIHRPAATESMHFKTCHAKRLDYSNQKVALNRYAASIAVNIEFITRHRRIHCA